MPDNEKFGAVFDQLKRVMQAFETDLAVQANEPDHYYLNFSPSDKVPKATFFGAVQIKKNYVSFHLMPVYMYPDLLDGISDALKKRMQGKSCFNFTALSAENLNELAALTEKSVARCRQEQLF
ncbi:MAG: hypothetical protein H7175_06730 [Burkholderiales bacterium]|nr:hypothetical protein [Anaerolineae bacterium]